MAKITNLTDDALIAFDNLADMAGNLVSPTLRFGVTGLSRAGKTVFITSLVHHLLSGSRLPMFEPQSSGRIAGAILQPQPSMNLPRFEYERHLERLIDDRVWPESTRSISELRLAIRYESASTWNRTFGSGTLNIDIVDYPGEWLLDLPLLGKTYEEWSKEAIALSHLGSRKPLAFTWHRKMKSIDPADGQIELIAEGLAREFTAYLRACKEQDTALSTLPPGRFLMPGDLEGSPALTFAPLDLKDGTEPVKESLHAMMRDRYEAYKTLVVKPFFREHFARIDRQIVLVDALQAMNAGPEAVRDLQHALSDILTCFRPGNGSWLSSILGPRTDKILFAATKADHLHHENHDRLERILQKLVSDAAKNAQFAGAQIEVMAMASVRSTTEAMVEEGKEKLPVIVGTPVPGEMIDGVEFDGKTQTAVFPGDLPANPDHLFRKNGEKDGLDLNFVRFRPSNLQDDNPHDKSHLTLDLPHIRLDRAMQFLFADKLG